MLYKIERDLMEKFSYSDLDTEAINKAWNIIREFFSDYQITADDIDIIVETVLSECETETNNYNDMGDIIVMNWKQMNKEVREVLQS